MTGVADAAAVLLGAWDDMRDDMSVGLCDLSIVAGFTGGAKQN
jgi:hypothetical protein